MPKGKERHSSFRTAAINRPNAAAVASAEELRVVSEELLAATDLGGHRVRLIGLTVGNSSEACPECVQLCFDFDCDQRKP